MPEFDQYKVGSKKSTVDELFYNLVQEHGIDGVEKIIDDAQKLLSPGDEFDSTNKKQYDFIKLYCASSPAVANVIAKIIYFLKTIENLNVQTEPLQILARFKPEKVNVFLDALCDLKIEGGYAEKQVFYSLVFDKNIFSELVMNEKSRDRIFKMYGMLGKDFELVSDEIGLALVIGIEKVVGNREAVIKAVCESAEDTYKLMKDLLISCEDSNVRETLIEAAFYQNTLGKKHCMEDAIDKLTRAGFSKAEIIEVFTDSLNLNYNDMTISSVNAAMDTISILGISPSKEITKYMIYETVFTKMDPMALKQGAEILNLLCPQKDARAKLAKKFGAGLFQILYLLHNSWRAEMMPDEKPKVTYQQAINIWKNKMGVKDNRSLLISILKLCMNVFHKHGIRYWGRFSLNALQAIKRGETGPESALMIMTKYADENGAFYANYKDMEVLQAEGYNLVVLIVEKDWQIFDYLDKRVESYWEAMRTRQKDRFPLFVSLDLSAHGLPEASALSRGGEDEDEVDCSDDELSGYSVLFKEGARISLDSCFTKQILLGCMQVFFKDIRNARFEAPDFLAASDLRKGMDGKLHRVYY